MKIKTMMLSLCVALGAAAVALAVDKAAPDDAADRQKMVAMHEKMAEAHKQAAECLKAGKPVKECHDALVAQCPMGKDGSPMMGDMCPMMGRGKGMRGQGRGKGRGMGPGKGTGQAPAAEPVKPADDIKP
ncbi:MAG: hypothetical protein ACHQ51_11875 [Elusimicrobiota bacterium]